MNLRQPTNILCMGAPIYILESLSLPLPVYEPWWFRNGARKIGQLLLKPNPLLFGAEEE